MLGSERRRLLKYQDDDNDQDEDDEKNDIISVEDEIYNLAFRPAKFS